MLGNEVFLTWGNFLAHNVIYWYLNDYIKNGKKRFEMGRSYRMSQIVKIVYIAVFYIYLLFVGRNCISVMPVLINHDYRAFSGKVLEIEYEKELKDRGIYNMGIYNYEVLLDAAGEKKHVDYLCSPRINRNDKIVYYVSTENVTKPVIQINNRDVTKKYERKLPFSTPDSKPIIFKMVFSIYLILFIIYHSYLMKVKYNAFKAKRQQNIRFILGMDREHVGFKLWLCGCIGFVIVGITALANIANNLLLGILMEISVYMYALGYLIVVLEQNRDVILINGKVCIKYDNGCKKEYATNQVTSIMAIKNKTYNLIFEDETMLKLTIHNEKQRELLDNVKEGVNLCIS